VPTKRFEATPASEYGIIPDLLAVVVLLALAMGLALEHQTRLELREERQALRQQVDRITAQLAENEARPTLQAAASPARPIEADASAERLRLQTEVHALRQLTNEWTRASNENAEAHAALDRYIQEASPKMATADFWPQDSWSFAGFASPDDALRSSLWASNNGNVQALLNSSTGVLLQMIQKEFEGKSADEAAIRAIEEVENLKSVQVLNREYQSGDAAVLTAAFEEGTQTHTNRLLLQRIGNQWKLAGMDDNQGQVREQ
jgi:hypothetical protein